MRIIFASRINQKEINIYELGISQHDATALLIPPQTSRGSNTFAMLDRTACTWNGDKLDRSLI